MDELAQRLRSTTTMYRIIGILLPVEGHRRADLDEYVVVYLATLCPSNVAYQLRRAQRAVACTC